MLGAPTLTCLPSFPFRDLKPENILLDDYGKLGSSLGDPFPALQPR